MTSTAKNFAGQNLRGRSFKEQDLSGSDFSGSDLRGADFTDAITIRANFSNAKTGVQKRWLILQLLLSFSISAFVGFLSAWFGVLIGSYFDPKTIDEYTIAPVIAVLIVLISLIFAIVRQGFSSQAFVSLSISVTIAVVLTLVSIVLRNGAIFLAVSIAGAITASGGVAVVGAIALMVSDITAGTIALCINVAIVTIFTAVISINFALSKAVIASTVISVSSNLLIVYVAQRTLKGDKKFDLLLRFAIAFVAIFGTSFRGVDLAEADFTEALLKSSDFSNSYKPYFSR